MKAQAGAKHLAAERGAFDQQPVAREPRTTEPATAPLMDFLKTDEGHAFMREMFLRLRMAGSD